MTLFVTLNDNTGTCLDVEDIKAIVGLRSPDDEHYAVVVDRDGQQYNSPLTPSEIRARIDSVRTLATN